MSSSLSKPTTTRAAAAPAFAPSTLAEQVYAKLRGDILAGRYAPGDRLVTQQLADELGVSLTPVRESIQRLAEERLLELRPHRGAIVAQPDPRALLDLYEVRAALERLATQNAAERISSADLRILRDTLAVRRSGRGRLPDSTAWIAADQLFHQTIVQACGNRLLVEMLDSLQDRIRLHRQVYFAHGRRIEQSLREHLLVVEALERRQGPAAADAMYAHLTSYRRDAAGSDA